MSEGLLIALIVAALIVCGFVVFALVELVRTLRSVRTLADELTRSVPPLIEKADVTVDALNVELLRVDTIIGEVEVLSSKVGHTVNVVQDAVNLPATAVGTAGERIRTAWHRAKRHRAAQTGPTDDH
ncbi:MAG: hypothetical protein ACNA76_07630 [Anaerosomatales bacterium]